MDFFETVEQRHSIRAYRQEPIPAGTLDLVLKAANQAPSAGNLQAYEIYVVTDAARRQRLAAAANGQSFLAGAPVVLVFAAHPQRSAVRYGRRGTRLYAVQDATIACAYATLAATAAGLGATWVGAFNEQAVAEVLDLPEEIVPAALLPIGFPAEEAEIRPRRKLGELVHYID